jgi:diketogulonate reductase-like aldo/keto reductase
MNVAWKSFFLNLMVRFFCISEKRLRDAYDKLKKRGIPLASNQVNYSLIYRAPEENGVKAACDELGISLIAYSPIAQGKFPTLLRSCFNMFIMCYIYILVISIEIIS